MRLPIAKHCPLKQGLRQILGLNQKLLSLYIAKHCPLKQGLRLLYTIKQLHNKHIAKHCPLKQGLRLLEIRNLLCLHYILQNTVH